MLAWHHPEIAGLTIYTQDVDTVVFQSHAEEILKRTFGHEAAITITYKSNDAILCQMYRNGNISIEEVKSLRKDARRVTFTQNKPDESVMLAAKVLDNDAFVNLIADPKAQILF